MLVVANSNIVHKLFEFENLSSVKIVFGDIVPGTGKPASACLNDSKNTMD